MIPNGPGVCVAFSVLSYWTKPNRLRNINSLQATAISWLGAEFNLLLTATPLFNCVEDFKGLVPLLIPQENDELWPKLAIDPSVLYL